MLEKRNFAVKEARKEVITIIKMEKKALLSVAVGLKWKDKSRMIAALPDDQSDIVRFVAILSSMSIGGVYFLLFW